MFVKHRIWQTIWFICRCEFLNFNTMIISLVYNRSCITIRKVSWFVGTPVCLRKCKSVPYTPTLSFNLMGEAEAFKDQPQREPWVMRDPSSAQRSSLQRSMARHDKCQLWTAGSYVAPGSSYWQEREPETNSFIYCILLWKHFGNKLRFCFSFLNCFPLLF